MSGVSSAESSAQHPVKCPGNSRVFFGQRPGNGQIASEPMLANVRHDVRSRIQSMTSPRPVRVRAMSRSIPHRVRRNIRPTSDESSGHSPGNSRAVPEQLPGNISRNTGDHPHSDWRNSREASGQLPLNSEKLSAWQTRSVQVGVYLADRTASGESSAQFPTQCS